MRLEEIMKAEHEKWNYHLEKSGKKLTICKDETKKKGM